MFALFVSGREIGKEKFNIASTRGHIEAQAEIELRVERDGKVLNFKTFPNLVLDSELRPVTYSWKQKGPQSSSLELDFRPSPVQARYRTVAGDVDKRDFTLPKDVLILDDNVFHHYQLIVDRYKLTTGGKQTFQAFVPQEALPGVLTVEDAGEGTVNVQGHPKVLQHLLMTTELTRVDVWVDKQQRLQLVSIPEVQLEAVRQE